MQTKTHWKKLTNPNYMGVYSLENGADIVRTIKAVKMEDITDSNGQTEQKGVCYFAEEKKPMIMNKTNLEMIATLLKSDYVEDWIGKKIQIGSEKVRAFGTVTDALRVRSFLPSQEEIKCEECGNPIAGAYGMTPDQLAAYTKKQYGKQLCAVCATKAKEAAANAE